MTCWIKRDIDQRVSKGISLNGHPLSSSLEPYRYVYLQRCVIGISPTSREG